MFNQIERCKFNAKNRFKQIISEEKYTNKIKNYNPRNGLPFFAPLCDELAFGYIGAIVLRTILKILQ